jgi:GrpB-like predicted nucleotidyltransferase (UPF0157 family)
LNEVILSSYCAHWPILFEQEKAQLFSILKTLALTIEHVGSTSVPGLSAKPIIDILLVTSSLKALEAAVPELTKIGYESRKEALNDRHYFYKKNGSVHLVHLHCLEKGAIPVEEMLAFRDYLKAFPKEKERYERLKQHLAEQYAGDRRAYTKAKAPFIQEMIGEALKFRKLLQGPK